MPEASKNERNIEDRLRTIEDRLEIYQLIASHPISADTGADHYSRAIYVEDGSLDLGRGKGATGNESIAAIVKTPDHQAAMDGGLAHFAGLPLIEIDGDEAVVTSYLQILTPDHLAEPVTVPGHGTAGGYRIHRIGANRWELTRTPQGWRIKRRVLRPLDGSAEARALLAKALEGFASRA